MVRRWPSSSKKIGSDACGSGSVMLGYIRFGPGERGAVTSPTEGRLHYTSSPNFSRKSRFVSSVGWYP